MFCSCFTVNWITKGLSLWTNVVRNLLDNRTTHFYIVAGMITKHGDNLLVTKYNKLATYTLETGGKAALMP